MVMSMEYYVRVSSINLPLLLSSSHYGALLKDYCKKMKVAERHILIWISKDILMDMFWYKDMIRGKGLRVVGNVDRRKEKWFCWFGHVQHKPSNFQSSGKLDL